MDRTFLGQSAEKASAGLELRRDARLRVSNPEEYCVTLKLGHISLNASCLDYSPFGLGLRIAMTPDLPLISIGEIVDLECDFCGSKFNARGVIVNTRVESLTEGEFVRLGISLSRTGEIVRSNHIKRRSARIHINEGVAPLVIASDELRFGGLVFSKMTDISNGGMRLSIDRHPLPFMEKQKHWFEIVLPVFGTCRAYCRIAYVRRDETAHRYIVGCEFVDGGAEQELRPLEDWLFYGHDWLNAEDIKGAGFELAHVAKEDEKFRTIINGSDLNSSSSVDPSEDSLQKSREDEAIDFIISDGVKTQKISAVYSTSQNEIGLVRVAVDSDDDAIKKCFWKAMIVFSLHNKVIKLKIGKVQTSSRFLKDSLPSMSEGQDFELLTEKLISSDALKWGVWKKIYLDLKGRKDFPLPEPSSFIRRLLLF